MNFDEQLMEILNKYMSSNLSADPRLWFDTSTTHKAIKELIREIVPDEHDYEKCPYCIFPDACVGYHDFRVELLERLGE